MPPNSEELKESYDIFGGGVGGEQLLGASSCHGPVVSGTIRTPVWSNLTIKSAGCLSHHEADLIVNWDQTGVRMVPDTTGP